MRKVFKALFCILPFLVFGQIPPSIVIEGEQNYCPENPMPIVTNAEITNTNGTDAILQAVYIQISLGYSFGQDILLLTGSHPNINAVWSSGLGELTLNGPATYSEFINAIEDVRFQTTQSDFSEDKFFSVNLGNANYLPSTEHYYFYVSSIGITWDQARDEAASSQYFGLQGYLATITTEEEAQLAGEQSSGTGWIGATDAETEAIWKWVTGPEEGVAFYNQNTGEAINNEFSFWNTNEPNDFGGEDYAHITDPSIGILGSWNDLPIQGDVPESPYHPQGYLVEFGGMPGDPDINVSASTTIITPKTFVENVSVCEFEEVTLNVTTNTDTVLWFETNTSTTPIYSGFSFTTSLNNSTTFWVLPLFQGCDDGTRMPISVTVNALPQVQDISIIQCGDENTGISIFNLTNYIEDITLGNSSTVTVDFFLDQNLTIPIDATNFENTFQGQIVYAKVIANNTLCYAIAEVSLFVNNNSSNSANLVTCDDITEDGLAVFNLEDANSQLLEGLPNGVTISYFETYEDVLLQQNILQNNYTNTLAYNQTIFALLEENGDCYGISEVSLEVISLPELSENETRYYCLNDFPTPILLTGGVENDNPSNYYYTWSTGDNTSQISVNEPGVYTVTVTATNGCFKERIITVLPSNIASILTFEVDDAQIHNTITVIVSGEGEYQFALDNIDGVYQTSNIFNNVPAGIHTVYVKDIKNDCGIVFEDVSVIGFPKFFTPNGDAYNQTWEVRGISDQFQPNTKIQIFNRYGHIVAEIDPLGPGWNGNINGSPAPSDDYWFEVVLQDGRVIKNHFTLKR